MYIKEERVINEPVEIIGETNYDNSHKFILHSPIFNDYDYVNKLRRIIPEYRIETSGNYDEIVVYADKDELKYIQRAVDKFNSRYCQHGMYNQEVNEAVEIEVENPGVLEVPEGKNVEDLPIKHFVALANKKGLSTITKALNNLQVWNKNKNKPLSKWARDMIDKVTKRVENQKKESLIREFSSNFDGTEFGEVEFYSDDLYKWKDEDSIISAIEAHSPIDINVYGVEFEPSHNLVITYEVRTEDYDEDRIEAIVIDSLEKLEDRIRDARPKYGESLSVKDVRALVNDNTAMNILSDIERIERNRFSSTKYEFQHNRKQVKNKVKEINDIISNKISDIEDADNEYVSAFESCGRNVYEDVNNLSNSELITEIKDMISKIKFIKIPLRKEDIWGNGQTDKESREILNHAVYEAVGGIYYDTPYPITIENAKFTYSLGTRGKVVLLNVENGTIWTCTKGGNVDMFSGYTKTEKLRRIYNSLQTVLDK